MLDCMMTNTIPPLTVLDSAGTAIPLQHLWEQSPVVLVFVRHFG